LELFIIQLTGSGRKVTQELYLDNLVKDRYENMHPQITLFESRSEKNLKAGT